MRSFLPRAALVSAGIVGPEVYFYDSFTDTDGVGLASHVPDVGTGWTELVAGTDPQISSNKLRSFGTCEWRCDQTSKDCTITATLTHGATQHVSGIRFRGTSPSNFSTSYLLWMDDAGWYVLKGLSGYLLWPHSNNNTTQSVRIECNGSSVIIYIDGVERFNFTDTYAPNGSYHGFRFYQSSDNYLDEFKVEEYNAL